MGEWLTVLPMIDEIEHHKPNIFMLTDNDGSQRFIMVDDGTILVKNHIGS